MTVSVMYYNYTRYMKQLTLHINQYTSVCPMEVTVTFEGWMFLCLITFRTFLFSPHSHQNITSQAVTSLIPRDWNQHNTSQAVTSLTPRDWNQHITSQAVTSLIPRDWNQHITSQAVTSLIPRDWNQHITSQAVTSLIPCTWYEPRGERKTVLELLLKEENNNFTHNVLQCSWIVVVFWCRYVIKTYNVLLHLFYKHITCEYINSLNHTAYLILPGVLPWCLSRAVTNLHIEAELLCSQHSNRKPLWPYCLNQAIKILNSSYTSKW